jgi:hypothetical protein
MAYARSAIAPSDLVIPDQSKPARAQRGLLRRLFDAIEQSNMRRAEREIERYMRISGFKFTDETEREIERRFLGAPPKR